MAAAPAPSAPRRGTFGRRLRRTVVAAVTVLVLLVVVFLVYAHTVLPGDRTAALRVWRDDRVAVRDVGDAVVMTPTGDGGGTAANGVGIVFVPGAKVDPFAYMATFRGVVAHGTTVVITKPTLNLAFFDLRPLSTFEAAAPSIRTWAVGGHSLGGVRACQLAAGSGPGTAPAGLLLLGSYCANDLSHTRLDVLSLAGSRDGLSTPAKVAAARNRLPASADMVEIPGANHARFGAYGVQPGDGTATASRASVDRTITRQVDAWVATLR
ncbi:alpha/beta hydrolase [Curtobacterium sp. RRHDQ10]|uniref:alpha/beta hydrolase n=1 Tax=Curtobacterium phyllosphaerae TaxID=3413379 RepID=UPI003BF138CF